MLFKYTLFLLGTLGKLCQDLAFDGISVHSLHQAYEKESLKTVDLLKCTQLWFSEDDELRNISISKQSRGIAKKLDAKSSSVGAMSFPLHGIPVMLDRKIWKASAFGPNTGVFPIKNLMSHCGAVPIVVTRKRSLGLIMKAVVRNKAVLGIVLEETPIFNKMCLSLICLKISKARLLYKGIPSSVLKLPMGLITKNIEDLLASYKAFVGAIVQSSSELSQSRFIDQKRFRSSYSWHVAIVPFNSTEIYQPFFGPLATTLHQMGAYIQPVLLNRPSIKYGSKNYNHFGFNAIVFNSTNAITEIQLKLELSNAMYSEAKLSKINMTNWKKSENNLLTSYSRVHVSMLGKCFFNQLPNYSSSEYNWLQKASIQVLNQFIDTNQFEYFATSINYTELLKIVEWTGLPSVTIPSYHKAQKTSITIVSLYCDEAGLLKLASDLLSNSYYNQYN